MKNIINKLDYFIYIFFLNKFLKNPYHCHFQITRKCNFRCMSCCVWKNPEQNQTELPLEEIKILAKNLRKIGVKSIAITGGEPLLRKDLPQIIEVFKAQNFLVRLQTNGSLADESFLETAFKNGIDDLYFSLDTLKSDVFAQINGIENEKIFENVIQNIKTASKLAKKYKVGVFLTTVVQKLNFEEIENLENFARENACLIGFYGLEIAGKADKNNIRSADEHLIPDENLRLALKKTFIKIKQMKKEKNSPIFNSDRILDDYISFYSAPNASMYWKCNAGRDYLEILPDGKVGICNATPEIQNLNYENILDFYKNKNKEQTFIEYRKKCSGCICTRQLEYLITDVSDVAEKAKLYLKNIFKR